jgi:hypothetical protein
MAKQRSGISPKILKDPFTSNRGYQGLFSSFQSESKDLTIPSLWDGSCGLDKGRITIPISNSPNELTQGLHNLLGRREIKGLANFDDFPDLFFSSCATPVRAVQVEFNFANFTKSFGLNLCPFGLAPHIVQLIVHHTVEQSGWIINPLFFPYSKSQIDMHEYPSTWRNDVHYSRLELARDFTINDPRFKLEQMRYIRPQRAKAVTATINEYELNTLSHPAGSRSLRLAFYDKSRLAQSIDPGRYPAGTFRFEAKLPRAQLKRHYLHTVTFGTHDSMYDTLGLFWKRSNYWKPLLHEGNVHQELLEAYGNMDGALLIGYADSCAKGMADFYSKEQHYEYGQILKAYGIKRFVPLDRQGTPFGQLDFAKGTLDY